MAGLRRPLTPGTSARRPTPAPSFWRQGAWSTATAGLLLIASVPTVYSSFGDDVTTVAASMRQSKLNKKDLATLERSRELAARRDRHPVDAQEPVARDEG